MSATSGRHGQLRQTPSTRLLARDRCPARHRARQRRWLRTGPRQESRHGSRHPVQRAVMARLPPLALLLVAVTVAAAAMVAGAGSSWAYWSAPAFGHGVAAAGTLTPPAAVTATAAPWRPSVEVSWTPASASYGGPPQGGYYVTRVDQSDGATSPACGTLAAAPTMALSCTDGPVPDGVYTYRVTALDHTWTAVSAPSEPTTVISDLTAPTIAISDITPSANTSAVFPSSPVTLTLTGADPGSGLAAITYTIDAAAPATVTGGAASVIVTGDGTHTVSYRATDHAGNTSSEQHRTITIDTTPPGVTVTKSAQQPNPTRSATILFGVTFTEPVTGFTSSDLVLSGAAAPTSTTLTGSGASYLIAVSGMTGDGNVTVTVPAGAATDVAGLGNTSSDPGATVVVDTTAPPAPAAPALVASSDTGTSATDKITADNTPTLTGAAEAGATITVYSDGNPVGSGPASNGAYAITTASLPDGQHRLTVTATDTAGNTSTPSTGTPVRVDTTTPPPPPAPDLLDSSDTGASTTDNITADNTPTLTGTAEAGTAVTLTSPGGTPIASGSATDGTYTMTTATIADGGYTLTATATDTAGNTSTASAPTTITVDTTAPTIVITTFASAGNGQVRATGTAGTAPRDAATVTVVICGANTFPCPSPKATLTPAVSAAGAWTATTPDLRTCALGGLLGQTLLCTGPGQLWAQATQTDLAGNTATSNTRTGTF
ncbi:Ig-like domain-containing protein [Pedococcus sp. 5OH_020]|uniref:Ig-like domain-containing protein n=1 Tax=Pedococcus sp. 5OH_020 TaxID=2989814 RepID=UPI0022E99FE8|nr:Ig-like domain-containing protein [Pedococcus sp. 5OH_020]